MRRLRAEIVTPSQAYFLKSAAADIPGQPAHLAGHDHLYVVTNKHVATGANKGTLDKIARATSTLHQTKFLPVAKESWCLHSLADVAIAPVAMPLLDPEEQLVVLPYEGLVTENIAAELWIGPGDDVFMVGQFSAHDGRPRNMLSVRFGHISTMPDKEAQIQVDGGQSQDAYLVEGYSYSGYSGSPVILSTPTWELSDLLGQGENNPRNMMARVYGTREWLLGINCGHLTTRVTGRTDDGKEIKVRINAGMSCVVPAWKILEVLNSEELREQRARATTKP